MTMCSFVQRADGTTIMRLDRLMATSLSSDGKSVAAVSDEGELFIVSVREPSKRLLVSLPGLKVQAARWFHDGRRLLVIANHAERTDLYVADLRGGSPLMISRHGAALACGGSSVFQAAISTDDEYVAALDSSYHIAILDSDGSRATTVPGRPEVRKSPLFSQLQFH